MKPIARTKRIGGFVLRHRRGTGASLVAIVLFAGGAWIGWTVRDRRIDRVERVDVSVDRPVQALAGADASKAAPNVLGLSPDGARQVLFDAGVASAAITVVNVPAAGTPGVIVSQDPPPGIPVTDKVTLGVSQPTTVPDLTGKPLADARKALDQLGARITVHSTYVNGTPEGTVVSTDPPPGSPLGPEVALVVTSAPSSAFLSQLHAGSSNCNSGDATANGTKLPSSLLCATPSRPTDPARQTIYLLNRLATELDMTIAQLDTSTPGSVARVVILADGNVIDDETVAYGEAKNVTRPLTDVLRLEIDVSLVNPSSASNGSSPTVVLGSARVVGGPDAINQLVSGN